MNKEDSRDMKLLDSTSVRDQGGCDIARAITIAVGDGSKFGMNFGAGRYVLVYLRQVICLAMSGGADLCELKC